MMNNKHLHIFRNQLNFQLEYIKNASYNINKKITPFNINKNKHLYKYLQIYHFINKTVSIKEKLSDKVMR